MKRYLVKETSVATENNPNFKGKNVVAYFGKNDRMLKYESNVTEDSNFDHISWLLEEYGYRRECDARKNYTYNNPENTKYWSSTIEIICFDI